MNRKISDLIYERRATSKIALETYVLDKYNSLDSPIEKVISELGKRLKKNWKEHDNWINIQNTNPEQYQKLKDNADDYGNSLEQQLHFYIIEIINIEEEILALLEVQIIYAFKHFEINLKKLVRAAYNDESFDKNYKWESVKQYLNSRNINIKTIKNYAEVNQLRDLNNAIKHSETYFENDYLQKLIPEFQGKNISIRNLFKFYKRIKDCTNSFLHSLSLEIYNDLYNFDDEKLNSIAESLALRMDKENAEALINRIRDFY
ncbi:MAG: hypothetical protein LC112_09445 [Flavobacteriales bacterium]|nr:hypothetical protein [Flavobacteriales bacterium]